MLRKHVCVRYAPSAKWVLLQADAQIYNKVLALIEDWADAINLPAYRQEYNSLKVQGNGPFCA